MSTKRRDGSERRVGIGQVRGSTHPAACLTEADVKRLRLAVKRHGRGLLSRWARRARRKKIRGMSLSALYNAVYKGKYATWTHLPGALHPIRTLT